METRLIFKVAKVRDGERVYWDGSESPYATESNSFHGPLGAYTTGSFESIAKKVKKVRKKFTNKYTAWINHPNEYYNSIAQDKLTMFNDTFIEVSEVRVISEVPIDESI